MKKTILIFFCLLAFQSIFANEPYIYGIKSFSKKIEENKLTGSFTQSLFFHLNYNSPDLKAIISYDDDYMYEDGIQSINVNFKNTFEYGFFYDSGIFESLNRKYTGLQYHGENLNLTAGFQTGTRFYENIYAVKNISIYFLSNTDIVENSEVVSIDGIVLTKNIDYFIDYYSGILTLDSTPAVNSEILIWYSGHNFAKTYEKNIYGVNFKNSNYEVNANDIYSEFYINNDFYTIKSLYLNDDEISFQTADIKYSDFTLSKNFYNNSSHNSIKSSFGDIYQEKFSFKNFKFTKFNDKKIYSLSNPRVWDYNYVSKENSTDYHIFSIENYADNIFTKGDFNFRNSDDFNGDFAFSKRFETMTYYQRDIVDENGWIHRNRTLTLYKSEHRITAAYFDSEKEISFGKVFANYIIEYGRTSTGKNIVDLNYTHDYFTINYRYRIKNSFGLSFRKNNFLLSLYKDDGDFLNLKTDLSLDDIKISFYKDNINNNIWSVKNYIQDGFFDLTYNYTQKTGTISYNLLIE